MKINFKNKTFEIKARECRGIKKALGLMFSGKKAKALIFRFKNQTKTPIHSLFCPEFLAVWLLNMKVIEYKIIKKTKLSIIPRKNFNSLIEIPINKKYEKILRIFKT